MSDVTQALAHFYADGEWLAADRHYNGPTMRHFFWPGSQVSICSRLKRPATAYQRQGVRCGLCEKAWRPKTS